MSQIEKLLVRGIRSFDPSGTNIIEFYTPLTIIVGHNGAGKTTIIECLKYATTGDLPPNSRNGAFIHDPKLAQENEVKAQIKLRFRNVNGREMVITRSMSLTQKKTTRTMKTIESLLQVLDPETGKKSSLSTRCAELDAELPLQLGVSKAILENVIFCHQEESFWPLAEPSILKKKFDEIFASTRYTKALENIKALKKDKTGEIKVHQVNVDRYQADKEKADKVREAIEILQHRISVAEDRINNLDGDEGEIQLVTLEIKKLVNQMNEMQSVEFQVKQSQDSLDGVRQQMNELKETLQEYRESDEDLESMLQEYLVSVEETRMEQQDLERRSRTFNGELEGLQTDYRKELGLRGKLQAEQEAHSRMVNQRETIVVQLSQKHGYVGFSAPLSNSDIKRFMRKLQGEVDQRVTSIDAFKAKSRAKEGEFIGRTRELQALMASAETKKRMSRDQVAEKRRKIAELGDRLQQTRISQADIDEQKAKVEDEETLLKDRERSFNMAESDAKITRLNQELREKEAEITRVNDEIANLNRQADTRARLNLKKAEAQRKEEALNNLLTTHGEDFQQSLGHMPPTRDMERKADVYLREKERAVKNCEERLEKRNRELSSVDTKLALARSNLDQKTRELNVKARRIRDVAGDQEYSIARENVEEEVDEHRDTLSAMKSASSMYSRFIKKSNEGQCCPLCERNFDEENEGEKFLRKLEGILAKVPDAISKAETAIAEAETRRAQLRELHSVNDDVERLQTVEIPELQSRIEEYDGNKSVILSDIEDITSELAMDRLELQNAQMLRQHAGDIVRYQKELDQATQDVEMLSADLSISGTTKTLDEAQEEVEKLQQSCVTIRRDLDRQSNEKFNRQKDLQTRQNRIQDHKRSLQQLEMKFQEKEQLQKSMAELNVEVRDLQQAIEDADRQLNELQPQLREVDQNLETHRSKVAAEESGYAKDVDYYRESLVQLESIEKEIDRYIREKKEEQYRKCESTIESLEGRIAAHKQEIENLAKKVDEFKEQISNTEGIKRQINDNLRYRKLKRRSEELSATIDLLRDDVRRFNAGNLTRELERAKGKQGKLMEERAGLVGELKQMQQQAKTMDRELRTDYKDIEEKYRDYHNMLKTDELANGDMEKYVKALDSAVMAFHSRKMEDINKIIRELWINTYQGSDIDTIEIRSDTEGVKGNRSYNYRVVMVKGETALDMRGRCSAGQKVLTSLIIRLALAETFCINCGILALDEPTTNLDRDNIESLADSLAK
ncbi:DNA repair protein rad50 [Rhizophlyctis rosea]|nr:DNA repair protein rad50 [Rhizophlyctis rosea]